MCALAIKPIDKGHAQIYPGLGQYSRCWLGGVGQYSYSCPLSYISSRYLSDQRFPCNDLFVVKTLGQNQPPANNSCSKRFHNVPELNYYTGT